MTVGLYLPERDIVRVAFLDAPVEECLQPKSTVERGVLGRGAHGRVIQPEFGEETIAPCRYFLRLVFLLAFSVGMKKVINDGGQNRPGHILVNMSLNKSNHVLQRLVEVIPHFLGYFLRVLVTLVRYSI